MCISQQADDTANGLRQAADTIVIGPGHLTDAVGFDQISGLLDGEPVADQIDDVLVTLAMRYG
jgi:hypothetical protein